MIKKIDNIKNLAVFQDFKWDNSVLNNNRQVMRFEKINILYGRNYAGKTTLSRLIRSLEVGSISEKYDDPYFSVVFDDDSIVNQDQLASIQKNVRVFNEDFVRENLKFIVNPEDNVEPFAVLGDDNNALEQEIAILINEIGVNEESNESGLYKNLKESEKVYKEILSAKQRISEVLNKQLSEKAIGRTTGIKYKADKYGDQNYNITKLTTDIRKVLSEAYIPLEEAKKAEYELTLKEQIKSNIMLLSDLSLQWEGFCIETEELLSQKIGSSDKITELLLEASLHKWVKEGYKLHNEKKETCAFCGERVSDERWNKLHKHFDDESKNLEQKIDKLIKKIDMEMQTVQSHFSANKNLFYSKFHQEIENVAESYSKISSQYNEQLESLKIQLTKRKESIVETISFARPIDYSEELHSVLNDYEQYCIQSNDFTGNLALEQNNAKQLLRLQEVYDFCLIINYKESTKVISENTKKIEEAILNHDRIKKEIDRLEELVINKKRQLNDEGKGALLVNKYLVDFFGHEFLSLKSISSDSDGEKAVRFEIFRNGKRAYHLSEGECSLISFCYFVAKLNDVNTNGIKPVIWIDDPISSLDGNHIFFVYSLIAAEIAGKGAFEQLFVSTHNLDFLKYLRRLNYLEPKADGKLKSCSKQYFIVTRQGDHSTLLPMPKYLKEFGTEFNYLFSCIQQCSCIEVVDDSNFNLFYNFGNNARKFLEIYLYFKYPDFSEDKLERFFGEDKVPSILIDRINNEYSHLQGSIERAAMPIEVPEMVSTARLIIDKVKEDEDQYNAFMRSIGIDK